MNEENNIELLYQEIKDFVDKRKQILRFPTSGEKCSSCKYFELASGKSVHGTCLKKHRKARKTDKSWCHPKNKGVCRCCEKKATTRKYESKNITSFLCKECFELFDSYKKELEGLRTRKDEICNSCPKNKDEFGCIKQCILKIYKL